MSLKNRNVANDAAIESKKLNFFDRFAHHKFQEQPRVQKAAVGGAPTGTTGDTDNLTIEGRTWEYHIKGTQTIVAPVITSVGLDIGMDQTNNDGVELCAGILSNNWAAFVVATDAFYVSLKFKIEDVSGTDQCMVGFRKAAAYTADWNDYTDLAALNMVSGNITISTILNNAATTNTDTTNDWADGETHTFEVHVSAAGVVTYLLDGVQPTTVAAFTMDSGDTMVPFIYMLNDSDVVGKVELIELYVGLEPGTYTA